MSWTWYADVGNCTVHAAAWAAGEWRAAGRLPVDLLEAQEGQEALLGPLHETGLTPADCSAAVFCVSSPGRRKQVEKFISRCLGSRSVCAGDDFPAEVPTDYYDPAQLGVDRRLNALAAMQKVGKPCVVVDFGSCLTCDALTAEGVLTAGGIAPGLPALLLGLEGLVPHLRPATEEAMQMSGVNLLPPGRSTAQGLALGILGGLAATADRLVKIMYQTLGRKTPVIATGGDAHLLLPHCEVKMAVDEMLTLDGLRLAYERTGSA